MRTWIILSSADDRVSKYMEAARLQRDPCPCLRPLRGAGQRLLPVEPFVAA